VALKCYFGTIKHLSFFYEQIVELFLIDKTLGRILALDYGRKRVGVAVTDPLQIIANGLDAIPSISIIDFLENYFEKESIDLVVIGYPKQMNNNPSESVPFIDQFIKSFEKSFPERKYYLMDERFTSKMASKAMIDGGVKKMKRQNKWMIDKVSATIILQSYLEMKVNIPNFR
jgi:putative holliday junction resolvase